MTFFKKITFAILTFSIFGFFQAQKIDAKSKAILDAVTKNYKENANTYFKFVYGSGIGKITKTEPGIFYSAKDKYKLKIMGTEQIFDGNKVYNISDEDKEVTIAKPNGNESMFSPLSYLESYNKDYNVKYLGKIRVNGVNADRIQLTPIKDNGLKYVYLYVNSAKNELVKLEQFAKDKSISVIAIKDFKENQNLSADMFSFEKNQYKNYIITEL
ncbi:Outer membrane lipoprotein-sorting protein [Halpernia humi]|uniref:Outer membrane lipoprotein-sorting protein n=1 Tax=Halpernia humi TaxID=493375 RepID=A0A1H5T0K9_9FLAO|nr:outer membrane lipoprotein carrier protein LolA [Halpernia humi]SEF56330.1 Outer membrane lipoprotein-sorting protein [Halpernia humi]